MKIQILLKAGSVFLRALIVTLCFIIDVKVKADVIVEAVNGQVEFENAHHVVVQKKLEKFPFKILNPQNFTVQTYDTGTTRFKVGENTFGVQPNSILSFEKNEDITLSRGRIYLTIQKSSSVKIHTSNGVVDSGPAEFLLELTDGKTLVSVLSGKVNLVDRASNVESAVKAGYSSWLGGLLANGTHAKPLRPEACEVDRVLDDSKGAMGWNEKELALKVAKLKPIWKSAVIKVAEESQKNLDSDIKTLNEILAQERAFEEKRNQEQAKLRKLFRAKTIGLPQDLDRDPAGDF